MASEYYDTSSKVSSLGNKISKTGRILDYSSSIYLDEFQQQIEHNISLYDQLLKQLIVDKFDRSSANKTFKEFFNKETINFVAIDGTEYAKQFFDMVIFYAGAYTCEGRINFPTPDKIKTTYNEKFIDRGKEISSCVPIFINKIPEIDTSFNKRNHNNALSQLTEEEIIDNTDISKSLMTFSEFFLAYKIASEKQTDLIFMDRSISNVHSRLIYNTSKKKQWSSTCSILNTGIDQVKIDANDLTIARHYLINELLEIPPPRGDYLRFSLLFKILQNEGLNLESICEHLKISEKKKIKRIEKLLEKWIEEKVISKNDGYYVVNDKYKSTWDRIKKLVVLLGNQIFQSEKDPFIVVKEVDGKIKKEWLTTTDLTFLTLFSLLMLIEECWRNHILLVGITKDTVARDFSNHLIPIGIENSFWRLGESEEKQDSADTTNKNSDGSYANMVLSDRMLLQTTSLVNHDEIDVPWSIVEYDASFVMAIPDLAGKPGYVSGAVRNRITLNKLFLRSFVQLEKAKTNNLLRSNVLFIDRLVYPQFDYDSDIASSNIVSLVHEYVGEEKIDFILYKNNRVLNPLQNFLMIVLKSMSCPSIAESFGHNKALYIADKVAKWHNEEFRKIVDSTTILISNRKNVRNYLFYMNTFREKRHEYESNRRV